MTIIEKIVLDYPLPMAASVWKDLPFEPLLESCLADCQSDLELYDSLVITYSPYTMPEGTRQVTNCKSQSLMQTQTNQFVKHTFDKPTRQVACRFVPAQVTYKRDVTLDDLDTIQGFILQYFKAYVIIKMLDKEIAYLTAIKLESTTGTIDVEALRALRTSLQARVEKMQVDILFPSNG
jgi:hypothetical protein